MAAVAHNKAFAKKVDIPQNVGQEFAAADAAKGSRMKRKMPPFMGKESKAEEAKERKKFPSKKAYAKAEAKYEGEKPKKFADGGEIEEGPNTNIDDETRARAMRFARGETGPAASTPAPARRTAARAAAPTRSTGTPAGTGAAMRSEPEVKPAMGSRVERALKTYSPPTDDPYAGMKAAAPAAAMMAAPAAAGAAARGAKAVAEGAKKVADIPRQAGQRLGAATKGRNSPVPSMTDDVVASTTKDVAAVGKLFKPTGRGAAKAAQQTAGVRAGSRIAGRVAAGYGASKAGEKAGTAISDRMEKDRAARRKEAAEESGMKKGGKVKGYANGGMVRGGGAAKRGIGRGKMC